MNYKLRRFSIFHYKQKRVYRISLLNPLIDNVRSIKDINKLKILIDIEKIRLVTNLKGRKKNHLQRRSLYLKIVY